MRHYLTGKKLWVPEVCYKKERWWEDVDNVLLLIYRMIICINDERHNLRLM
jgi:hypothetical protein